MLNKNTKKFLAFFLFFLVSAAYALSYVPAPKTHIPDIPFFFTPMNFQTLEMLSFDEQLAGMIPDPFSDLIWNPAYILRQSKKSIYLDFNSRNNPTIFSVPTYSPYNKYDSYYPDVASTWAPRTTVNSIQASHHYHFAAIIPISSKVTLGFMNRFLYDVKPFRTTYYWATEKSDALGEYSRNTPERSDIDKNQQTAFGIQSQFIIGYRLSQNMDLSLRVGHYAYRRDGTLYDSKEGIYPHNSFDNLDDESFQINGDQIDMELGWLYSLGEKTLLGLSAGLISGESTEKSDSIDSIDSWSERDTDPKYYSIHSSYLEGHESYSAKGTRPSISLTFEKEFSEKWLFRSFLSYSWANLDLSTATESIRNYSGDYTYDDYYDYFRRRQYQGNQEGELTGSGERKTRHWKWFASIVFNPNKNISSFFGIRIQRYSFRQNLEESSNYLSNDSEVHSFPDLLKLPPENFQNFLSYEKNYSHEARFERWSAFLPLGIKVRIMKDLYVLLGTNIDLKLNKNDTLDGQVLYPSRIARKWENSVLIVEDIEINRYEEYASFSADNLDRSLHQHFGVAYKHSSGINLFVKSYGDIFHSSNWSFGLGFDW